MEISPMQFSGPPEFYADAVNLAFSPYGFTFEFGLQTKSPGDMKTEAIVRMSPQHALIYYQFLKKYLREFESNVGRINLPDGLFSTLQIEKDI